MATKRTPGYKREHGLTIVQQNAIDLLVQGKTDQETAVAVGVHRVTVTKWRRYDPYFQAELNGRRRALWGESVDRFRALVPKALDALERELEQGELSTRTALEVLKLAGLAVHGGSNYGSIGVGPEDPNSIIDTEVRRRRTSGGNPLLSSLLDEQPVTDAERSVVLNELMYEARSGHDTQ